MTQEVSGWRPLDAKAIVLFAYDENVTGHLRAVTGDHIQIKFECSEWIYGICNETRCSGIFPKNRLLMGNKSNSFDFSLIELEAKFYVKYAFSKIFSKKKSIKERDAAVWDKTCEIVKLNFKAGNTSTISTFIENYIRTLGLTPMPKSSEFTVIRSSDITKDQFIMTTEKEKSRRFSIKVVLFVNSNNKYRISPRFYLKKGRTLINAPADIIHEPSRERKEYSFELKNLTKGHIKLLMFEARVLKITRSNEEAEKEENKGELINLYDGVSFNDFSQPSSEFNKEPPLIKDGTVQTKLKFYLPKVETPSRVIDLFLTNQQDLLVPTAFPPTITATFICKEQDNREFTENDVPAIDMSLNAATGFNKDLLVIRLRKLTYKHDAMFRIRVFLLNEKEKEFCKGFVGTDNPEFFQTASEAGNYITIVDDYVAIDLKQIDIAETTLFFMFDKIQQGETKYSTVAYAYHKISDNGETICVADPYVETPKEKEEREKKEKKLQQRRKEEKQKGATFEVNKGGAEKDDGINDEEEISKVEVNKFKIPFRLPLFKYSVITKDGDSENASFLIDYPKKKSLDSLLDVSFSVISNIHTQDESTSYLLNFKTHMEEIAGQELAPQENPLLHALASFTSVDSLQFVPKILQTVTKLILSKDNAVGVEARKKFFDIIVDLSSKNLIQLFDVFIDDFETLTKEDEELSVLYKILFASLDKGLSSSNRDLQNQMLIFMPFLLRTSAASFKFGQRLGTAKSEKFIARFSGIIDKFCSIMSNSSTDNKFQEVHEFVLPAIHWIFNISLSLFPGDFTNETVKKFLIATKAASLRESRSALLLELSKTSLISDRETRESMMDFLISIINKSGLYKGFQVDILPILHDITFAIKSNSNNAAGELNHLYPFSDILLYDMNGEMPYTEFEEHINNFTSGNELYVENVVKSSLILQTGTTPGNIPIHSKALNSELSGQTNAALFTYWTNTVDFDTIKAFIRKHRDPINELAIMILAIKEALRTSEQRVMCNAIAAYKRLTRISEIESWFKTKPIKYAVNKYEEAYEEATMKYKHDDLLFIKRIHDGDEEIEEEDIDESESSQSKSHSHSHSRSKSGSQTKNNEELNSAVSSAHATIVSQNKESPKEEESSGSESKPKENPAPQKPASGSSDEEI